MAVAFRACLASLGFQPRETSWTVASLSALLIGMVGSRCRLGVAAGLLRGIVGPEEVQSEVFELGSEASLDEEVGERPDNGSASWLPARE